MNHLTKILDKVANDLEYRGLLKLAAMLDSVANAVSTPYGNQEAGLYEVSQTGVAEAEKVAERMLSPKMGPLSELIPSFANNYEALQASLRRSRGLSRSEMPVVSPSQAAGLVEKLRKGALGLGEMFSYGPLNVPEVKVPAGDLKPIQGQVYLDNALGKIRESGVVLPGSPITTRPLLASKDNDIIDGHHKWAAAMISDPSTPLTVYKIPLSISELLKMASAYGDSLGNLKNK